MPNPAKNLTYSDAGVHLEDKDAFTESIPALARKTFGPRVIDNPGGFAGLFRLDYNERLFARNHRDPVLVACADGVGTKLKLAIDLGVYDTLGIDLVAMNVNDLIVPGAEPLFFLDYIAIGKVDKGVLSDLVRGMVEGCRLAGCALLGGETAEMPGLYQPGDFDLAGFAVGVMDLERAVDPGRVQVGDVVLGLASSGVHSNGYTLVRRIVKDAGLDLGAVYPELAEAAQGSKRAKKKVAAGKNGSGPRASAARPRANGSGPHGTPTLGRVLLTPTRIYAPSIVRTLRAYKVKKVVGGMAHITGSGLGGNLARALHPRVDAVIDTRAWPVPPVFRFLQTRGDVSDAEMRRVFNMGIGFTLIVRPTFADSIAQQLRRAGERVYTIGAVVKGTGQVREHEQKR